MTAPCPIATLAWAGRPNGRVDVVLGRHDPRVRWGFYDPDGRFVRELAGEEVPEVLWTSPKIRPQRPGGGHLLVDLTGCIYVAVLAEGEMPDAIRWEWVDG